MLQLILILFSCIFLQIATAGNFLFYAPLMSKSVKLGFMPMVKGLTEKGHKVIFVSPFKEKKPMPNLEEIIHESEFMSLTNKLSVKLLTDNTGSMADLPGGQIIEISLDANRDALLQPELQKILLDDKIKIDVVVTIPVFGNEAAAWIARKKNAAYVQHVTAPFIMPWVALATGTPTNPSYMPLPFFPFSQYMSFFERVKNTLAYTLAVIGREFYILPKVKGMIQSAYPDEDLSDFSSMTSDVALSLNMGSPFTGDGLRPVMPNVIKAGLMGCDPQLELEGELKEWVEGAEHGVIFMSFGSVVQASSMPDERRKLFISALSKLKQRIVWKWEKDLADVPANIRTFPWLPQKALLAHPNVKLFITHGGAGSIQETICYKTPIVGIPIMGDQYNNLHEAITHQLGVVLPWNEVTEDNFLASIKTVLEDSSYQDSVSSLQNLILDAPLHPRDNAVWWLEYLLRHPHNARMKSPAKDLYWFQYFLLDIFCFLVFVLYVAYKVIRGVFSFLCRMCCANKSKQKTQ